MSETRHCEEQSDEAIQSRRGRLDCFAPLAMKRSRFGRVLIALALPVIVLCAGAGTWIWSLGPAPLGQNLEFSKQVLDRNGRLLRAYATTDGRWRLPAKVSDVDP